MIRDYDGFSVRVIDLNSYTNEPKFTSRNLYEEYIKKGSFLFQFTTDVPEKKIENFVKSKLCTLPKLYARKCSIREIDQKSFSSFLEEHHIQGSATCKYRIGLFHEGSLVGAMGFLKQEDGFNLNRLVFGNYQIVGGSAKLLNFFRESTNSKIITYSNNGYSDGGVYKRLGFVRSETPQIDMWYIDPNGKLVNRRMLQKQYLPRILGNMFDPSKTEHENLFSRGYKVWYGPGTYRWELDAKEKEVNSFFQ